jgi:hypothetical protein
VYTYMYIHMCVCARAHNMYMCVCARAHNMYTPMILRCDLLHELNIYLYLTREALQTLS